MIVVRLLITLVLIIAIYHETGLWTALAFLLLAIAVERIANMLKHLEVSLRLHGMIR